MFMFGNLSQFGAQALNFPDYQAGSALSLPLCNISILVEQRTVDVYRNGTFSKRYTKSKVNYRVWKGFIDGI